MEKQLACAAAISSSGLLPAPPSNQEENEYFPANAPARNDPLPCLRPPRQTACACCSIMS
jgi:hypothetical protein